MSTVNLPVPIGAVEQVSLRSGVGRLDRTIGQFRCPAVTFGKFNTGTGKYLFLHLTTLMQRTQSIPSGSCPEITAIVKQVGSGDVMVAYLERCPRAEREVPGYLLRGTYWPFS